MRNKTNRLLVVVDMQNDFITGALGNEECRAIVPKVVERVKTFDGDVTYTLDTHYNNYLDTQEGKLLPVKHCIRGTKGWMLIPELQGIVDMWNGFEKETFGSTELAEWIDRCEYTDVTFIGVCTDICVISNAMVVKAFNPEVKITVDSSCCAGVTKQSHNNALEAMKACQIYVI